MKVIYNYNNYYGFVVIIEKMSCFTCIDRLFLEFINLCLYQSIKFNLVNIVM